MPKPYWTFSCFCRVRPARHLSEQYRTSSQTFAHFFRQAKGRSHTAHIFWGRSLFFISISLSVSYSFFGFAERLRARVQTRRKGMNSPFTSYICCAPGSVTEPRFEQVVGRLLAHKRWLRKFIVALDSLARVTRRPLLTLHIRRTAFQTMCTDDDNTEPRSPTNIAFIYHPA